MTLKILHTSDWHLGKKLFKKDRYKEHQSFLNWILNTIKEHQIDALLIAGDIFDSINPSNSALKMYYDFLANVSDLGVKTYIISGNHDSSGLIESTQAILEDKNVFITTKLSTNISDHCEKIWDKSNSFYIKLKSLPYFRNYEILNWIESDENLAQLSHEQRVDLISKTLQKFFKQWPNDYENKMPSILMAHHLFGDFIEAGSEQALSLSGLDSIPSELVKDFNYVALGHIHKTQYISKDPPIVYPGSPIPMRFSESNKKNVSILTCTSTKIDHDFIEIPSFLPLIQLKTDLDQINHDIDKIISQTEKETYLEIIISLDRPVSGLTDKIRERLINTNIELISFLPKFATLNQEVISTQQVHSFNIEELFKNFYVQKYDNQNIPSEILNEFHHLLENIRHENTSTGN